MASPALAESIETLEELLLRMWRIRFFEIRSMGLFQEKLIRGSVHPYIGMEAIAVGVCSVLGDGDYITSTHRGHGHCIAKGLDLKLMMAEIIGRETGYCRGRGGSMHITAMDHGMLGADAIVGASVALATGAAYSLRLQGKHGVVVAFFGDGASNQGLMHEAMNMASVLSAPVVFVCEHNHYAISTPTTAATRTVNIADRAAAYGFPGVITDGNDVIAVRDAAEKAIERARGGQGPTLIEAKTYRVTQHSAATAADPRPKEEVDYWKEKDPIVRFSTYLQRELDVPQEKLDEIEALANQDVEAALEFALASPRPEPSAAFEDVYAPAEWLTEGRLA